MDSMHKWPRAGAAVVLYPQVLINVPLGRRRDVESDRGVKRAVASAEKDLAGSGRVLLRPSGTEPVIRVMVEGRSQAKVRRWAEAIASAVEQAG